MFVDNEFISYSNWKNMVTSGKIELRGPQNLAKSLFMTLIFQQQNKTKNDDK
jgi:hypothetical protein